MINEYDIPSIIEEAQRAGNEAFNKVVPQPMVVTDGRQQWHCDDGVCGFAWINLKGVRSNSKIGKAFIAAGFSKNTYERCLQYWVHSPSQSMTRKEAFAFAFADVLKRKGISAYVGSRMD
jgi:hypothetical protein